MFRNIKRETKKLTLVVNHSSHVKNEHIEAIFSKARCKEQTEFYEQHGFHHPKWSELNRNTLNTYKNLSSDTIHNIIDHHPDPNIRMAVASQNNLNLDHVNKMKKDGNRFVRQKGSLMLPAFSKKD